MESILSNQWIVGLITNAIVGLVFYFIGKRQVESENERIKKAAKSIDTYGRLLMETFGSKPEGQRHFNDISMTENQKNSVANLNKLGIISFESISKPNNAFEAAYHWTKFGDKVMEFLGVIKLPAETGRKTNKKYLFIAIRYFFVLVIPALLYFWIFQPFYKKELPQSQNEIAPPQKLSTNDVIRKVISDIIETPLGLGFRDFCAKNEGIVSINDKPITEEQSELSGAGIAEISIKVENGASNDFGVKPGAEHCIPFIKTSDQFHYELGQKKTLIKPEENILRKYFLPNEDIHRSEYKFNINFDNVKFFYKKNIYDNWAKGIVFFIFWESVLLLVIKIFKFLKFGSKAT